MVELPWGTPAAIGRLTLTQLACLMSERPPGQSTPLRSAAEYLAVVERIERDEARWSE